MCSSLTSHILRCSIICMCEKRRSTMVPFRWIKVSLFSLLMLQCEGGNETTESTTSESATTTISTTALSASTMTSSSAKMDTNTSVKAQDRGRNLHLKGDLLRWFLIVPLGLGFVIIIVVIITWKQSKGNNTQVEEQTADREEVCYVSVSFIRKAKRTSGQAVCRGEDEDGTVKASSSSADPSNSTTTVCSTVNKPKEHVRP